MSPLIGFSLKFRRMFNSNDSYFELSNESPELAYNRH